MKMRTPFLPILFLALALLGTIGFQTVMIIQERGAIATARSGQETPLANANKFRQSLDSLVGETRKLADGGNTNARSLLAALEQRGVRFGPEPNTPIPDAKSNGFVAK